MFRGAKAHGGLSEEAESHQLTGNIYQGKVINVLPGMQAAFVDIGLEKMLSLC